MSDRNVIINDGNDNIYPYTFDYNVYNSNNQSLDNVLSNKANTDFSNATYTPAKVDLLNLASTFTKGSVSGSGTTYVIGTKGHWRFVMVYAYETAQRGELRLYRTGTSGTTGELISVATGEEGYWQKQHLSVSGLIPPDYYVYVTYTKVESVTYVEQKLGG